MKNLTYKININSNAARFDTGGGGQPFHNSIIETYNFIEMLYPKCT